MSFASNQSRIRVGGGVTRGKIVVGGGIKRGGFTMYGGRSRRKNSNTPTYPTRRKSNSAVSGVSNVTAFLFLMTFFFVILTLAIGWIAILIAFAAPVIVVLGFLGLFALPFVGLTRQRN